MNDLKQELETLEKELKYLIECDPYLIHQSRLVMAKQEMIIGIMRLIIRQLESKIAN